MALRLEETEPQPWTLSELYAAVDPHGWDATRHSGYPTEWSEKTSTAFGDFDLGWVGLVHAVDAQAPGPAQPCGFLWMEAGSQKTITQPSRFATWARHQIELELGERPRWRRTLARLIESSGKEENAPIAPREHRGIDEPDEAAPFEKEQDAAQYLRWVDKLPLTRNVRVWATADTRDVLHVAAGQVDSLMLGPARIAGSWNEAVVHIDDWRWNEMLTDVDWLRAIYKLSAQQAEVARLFLQGLRQEAIATNLGIATSSANEQLDRARKKIRDVWGLSPASAPLHMRRQLLNERTQGGVCRART